MAAALTAATTTASAATTIGETFAPTSICSTGIFLQSTSVSEQYEAPDAGVITSWQYQAPADPAEVPQLKFKVARRAGPNSFTIVGESRLRTPRAGELNSFPVQIAVEAGDLLGFHVNSPGGISRPCGRSPAPGYAFHSAAGDPPPGSNVEDPGGASADLQLDLSATLETTPCKGRSPTIAGTSGADRLTGTPDTDVMVGLGGNDTMNGLDGKDFICGGAGRDGLKGGDGKDSLTGGGGRDTCVGGKGNDSAGSCETERST